MCNTDLSKSIARQSSLLCRKVCSLKGLFLFSFLVFLISKLISTFHFFRQYFVDDDDSVTQKVSFCFLIFPFLWEKRNLIHVLIKRNGLANFGMRFLLLSILGNIVVSDVFAFHRLLFTRTRQEVCISGALARAKRYGFSHVFGGRSSPNETASRFET